MQSRKKAQMASRGYYLLKDMETTVRQACQAACSEVMDSRREVCCFTLSSYSSFLELTANLQLVAGVIPGQEGGVHGSYSSPVVQVGNVDKICAVAGMLVTVCVENGSPSR